jgi:hypothetical protein
MTTNSSEGWDVTLTRPPQDLGDLPKAGRRFEHARYIQGSPKAGTARPDICTVTRVTAARVYYRTETGMRMFVTPDAFAASCKRWLDV